MGLLIGEGVETLLKLSGKLRRKPSFRMVLTAVGEFAYRRKDGILVIPLGALKP